MFRHVVWTVLCCLRMPMLTPDWFSIAIRTPKSCFKTLLLQTCCVRNVWRSPLLAQIRKICARSECVTFYISSATAVRKVAVCVTVGAPHSGFPIETWRRKVVDHIGGVAHGSVFFANCGVHFLLVGSVWHILPPNGAVASVAHRTVILLSWFVVVVVVAVDDVVVVVVVVVVSQIGGCVVGHLICFCAVGILPL